MSIELLEEDGQNSSMANWYRHEIKSFIWIFIWVSCQYSKPDSTLWEEFFAQLEKVDAIQCAMKKLHYVRTIPELPEDVNKGLKLYAMNFLTFLQNNFNYCDKLKANLARCSLQWENMQEPEPTASILEGRIGQLKAEIDGKVIDDVFRNFVSEIGFPDIEAKVRQAVKGIAIRLGPQVNLE